MGRTGVAYVAMVAAAFSAASLGYSVFWAYQDQPAVTGAPPALPRSPPVVTQAPPAEAARGEAPAISAAPPVEPAPPLASAPPTPEHFETMPLRPVLGDVSSVAPPV